MPNSLNQVLYTIQDDQESILSEESDSQEEEKKFSRRKKPESKKSLAIIYSPSEMNVQSQISLRQDYPKDCSPE